MNKKKVKCIICGKTFKRRGEHRRTCSKICSKLYMQTFRLHYAKEYRKMIRNKKQKETNDYFEIYQNYKWFMENDLSKYNNQWVCISKQRVVAHSIKIKDIMKYVEDHMLKNFTISKVEERLRM